MRETQLVLVPLRDGVLYGIYQDFYLVYANKVSQKTLDALIEIWNSVQQSYRIKSIFYARGPGSLSAIKLLHIFVHTLKIVSDLDVFACDSFYFNQSGAIFAFGNQYFIQSDDGVILESSEKIEKSLLKNDFCLPDKLIPQDFDKETQPLYVVPPV